MPTPEEQPEEEQQEFLLPTGQQIRQAREQLDLSREVVANTLNYAETTIYKIELGTIPVSRQFVEKWNKNFTLQLPVGQQKEQEPEQPAPQEKLKMVPQQEPSKAPVREMVPTNTMQFMFSPTKGVHLEFFGKINDADIRQLIRILNTIQEHWPVFP